MEKTYTLEELARLTGTQYRGSADICIHGVATLHGAGEGKLTFLTNPSYRRYLADTQASVVILRESDLKHYQGAALISPNPHVTYAHISLLFEDEMTVPQGVAESAVIHPSVKMGTGVSIGANSVIEEGVELGDKVQIGPGCVVMANSRIGTGSHLIALVTVYPRMQIGRNCTIHASTVIGSSGFGYANDNGRWIPVAQLGRVVIGDDVDIGASTTIDRGAIEDTVIENGVKLDNQIQIAHNCRVGENSIMAGSSGMAGSATLGKHCAVGGMSGIAGHLDVCDGVSIAGMSLVSSSIRKPGFYAGGSPLEEHAKWQKNTVRIKQLDDMARRLKKLEKELASLKEA